MSVAAVKMSDSHHKLMMAIGDAVAAHTRHSPMAIDEIVGILAFCAGSAIVSGCKASSNRRKMREVALSNVDNGMEAMQRAASGSSLILPSAVHH